MVAVVRSALLPHSARQMFELVNDIEQYPLFLPHCKSARVLSRSDDELVGELSLGRAGIRQQFVTRNRLRPPEAIDMELVEGDFSHFQAQWRFDSLDEGSCKVSLQMDFEFRSVLVNLAVGKLFRDTASVMVDAMVERAAAVYGK